MTSKARTREHYGARSYASEVAAPAGTGGRRISSLTKVRRRGPVRRRSMKIYLCMPSDRNPKKVIRANRFSGPHTLLRRKTGDRDNRPRLSAGNAFSEQTVATNTAYRVLPSRSKLRRVVHVYRAAEGTDW